MSDINMPVPKDGDEARTENGTDPSLQVTATRSTTGGLTEGEAAAHLPAARPETLIAGAVVVEPIGATGKPGFRSRETLDREMREIKDEVLRMGSLVASQIGFAIQALVTHDADLATTAIVGDGRINEAQRHIAGLITTTIATQQPVARDLRFLLSLDHVAYELERMGDHAASVAKQARKLAPYAPLKEYVDLPRMGEVAAQLVHGVLRALVDLDQDAARTVAAEDDEVDRMYHAIFSEVVALMRADGENVERGTRILFAAHYLERIGDRVTNIAEDVVFLATGDIEDLNP